MQNVNYIEIGKRIKKEREQNGITREEFSELVGLLRNIYLY